MRQDVAASKYGMVLDHSLFVEYQKYVRGEAFNRQLVNKILSYYHNDFLTNIGQYTHNDIEIPQNLKASLVRNGLTNQSLTDLAKLTTYKIVLTEERTNFPYVNIDEGRFTPAITTFYEGDEERNEARDYLKNLCQSARKSILLYDKHINDALKRGLGTLLKYILPDAKIQFVFSFNQIDVVHRDELKKTHPNLAFRDLGGVAKHHDRYLIIDDSIEVVLTSGFEYLQNQKKEISLVIRPIHKTHGLRGK